MGAEVDSRAYHLTAEDQDYTTDRHDRLVAKGILLLHFPPKHIKTAGSGVISVIGQAIEQGLRRPPLAIKGLPPAEGGTSAGGELRGEGLGQGGLAKLVAGRE